MKTYSDYQFPTPTEQAPESLCSDKIDHAALWHVSVVRPSEARSLTRELQDAYLKHLSITGKPHEAAAALGVAHRDVEMLRRTDDDFDSAHTEALCLYAERIQGALTSRALYGWIEPVYHQGEVVGEVLKRDHKLLELEAKRTNTGYASPKGLLNLQQSDSGVLVVSAIPSTDKDWLEQNGGHE